MNTPNSANPWFSINGALNATSYNGSLWQAFNDSIYPIADSDPGISLNLGPNNIVQLSFADYGQNIWTVMPFITQFLAPNVTRGLVTCTYPLSGQYDHLPRILFYVAAIFAVLGRHRTWVAEAALGIIIAYSATAAVHLFMLLGLYKFRMPYKDGTYPFDVNDSSGFGDVDFFGIAPVVSLTVVLLTPMLHWSETFRSHSAKIVIQCWAVVMFAASIAFLTLIREYGTDWNTDQIDSMAWCSNIDDSCQPIGTADSGGFPYFDDKEQFDRCQCYSLCGMLSPTAPLRDGSQMVPFLSYSVVNKIWSGKVGRDLDSIQTALFGLWIFAIIQGLSALLGSSSTQEAIRNRVFRILYGDLHSATGYVFKGWRRQRMLRKYGIRPREKNTFYWSLRRFFAKSVAAFIYLLRLFGMVLYPFLFISTLAFCELFASSMPVSEPSSTLGAWSPWAGSALIVLSAIILAVYPALRRAVEGVTHWIQYDAHDRPQPKEEATTTTAHKSLTDIKQHAIFNVLHFVWNSRQRRRRFFDWWRDPVRHSYPEKYDLDHHSMIEPECSCSQCRHEGDAVTHVGDIDIDSEKYPVQPRGEDHT
ncbi:hypothetical protein BT63DRAFT_423751 [Microthyrium microscopicum]|uniref:Uncharacterized protein n=1 Tax=Microthyrium microscopicum TaxID=703497 RepID=A0A6A6UC91_9PEZI|nr:hypothetical protein BT63DRAFT_423751 [Microthyrium microscopicum]